MSDYHAVLVYDGDCPFCSAAASALRRVEGVGAIAWEDDPAQSFLEAQFGETPFALAFADGREGRVYVGREAARELCDRAGIPVLVGDIVGDNYESLADAIRTVTGVDGRPDPYHGAYPMSEAAKSAFGELGRNAWHTAKIRR
ncbi:DCC1-like thiol-disulfide oxidoreductase family protein [Halorussus caseinilyticus]|uniref:DCC1-like thiol-disulfide oxidoreductase family protein n=1 Tax=Halorussus caseinilyticus TaxID=3034025 RepID=A0ABD5WJ45_9EURY|nr:DCC1-like thiol-disulfide oxidoreductase family protein [Halorussus sp. DT72]